jgi:hypothetical protein
MARIQPVPSYKTNAALAVCFLLFSAATAVPSWAGTQPDPPSGSPPNIAAACGTARPSRSAGALLTVDVRDQFGRYRSDQVTMVSDRNGQPLVTLACDGALAAFRLAPGSYRVEAFVGGERSQEVAIDVPAKGALVRLMLARSPNQPVNSPQID